MLDNMSFSTLALLVLIQLSPYVMSDQGPGGANDPPSLGAQGGPLSRLRGQHLVLYPPRVWHCLLQWSASINATQGQEELDPEIELPGVDEICALVGMTEAPATEGEVRAVDSDGVNTGRLEIFHGGIWGTVCNDGFGDREATVACRQLGYPAGRIDFGGSPGAQNDTIWIDEVTCRGNKRRLVDCEHSDWGQNNCHHNEDVSVICATPPPPVIPPVEDIRLVNGLIPSQGRVELLHGGSWGTVCDDGWGDVEAHVACRQLGYSSGTPRRQAYFGAGEGDILLDEVVCQGSEVKLVQCQSHGWGVHNCDHEEDAGVECH